MSARLRTTAALALLVALLAAPHSRAQPASPAPLPLSEVKAGQHGTVWTVFQGTEPEPFAVEVTGIIENALGPGKSLILCRLTDPRVQNMGAVAGMSGSPLYIDGRFAGALSYQVQQFETVRYAGFTPAADMDEVEDRVAEAPAGEAQAPVAGFTPLNPVFALGGVSPQTAAIMAPQLESLGIGIVALGGSSQTGAAADPLGEAALQANLRPGDAVSVALTTGDITLAGTGTVSKVDGRRVVAFGHPMLGMGNVQFPMCQAQIVAILPSTMHSIKVANVGPVIGCVSQDRLSAVSGVIGPGPEMTDVEVFAGGATQRRLHFQVVRDRHLAAMIMLTGLVEAVMQSNDAQVSEGFRIRTTVSFGPTRQVTRESVFAGQQAFLAGMLDFLGGLMMQIQNPFEAAMPGQVSFQVEPLDRNPAVTLEHFQVSRTQVRAGDTLQVTLGWRDFQGATDSRMIEVPVSPAWAGKTLEVLLLPGRALDELTGHGHQFKPGQLRSFDAYLDAMKDNRASDGLVVALVERSSLFFDQQVASPDVPASIQRIEGASDPSRYQRRDALVVLWETHVLEGKVAFSDFHRTVRVDE